MDGEGVAVDGRDREHPAHDRDVDDRSGENAEERIFQGDLVRDRRRAVGVLEEVQKEDVHEDQVNGRRLSGGGEGQSPERPVGGEMDARREEPRGKKGRGGGGHEGESGDPRRPSNDNFSFVFPAERREKRNSERREEDEESERRPRMGERAFRLAREEQEEDRRVGRGEDEGREREDAPLRPRSPADVDGDQDGEERERGEREKHRQVHFPPPRSRESSFSAARASSVPGYFATHVSSRRAAPSGSASSRSWIEAARR